MVEQTREIQNLQSPEPMIRFHVNGMQSAVSAEQVRDKLYDLNTQGLAAIYKEAAKNHVYATTLFGLKSALAALTPVMRLMVDTNRQDTDIPAWIRNLLLPVPTPPRHTDMLDFLCSYLIEQVVHIAASGEWNVNVAPVKNPDTDTVGWVVSDFKVDFNGTQGPDR